MRAPFVLLAVAALAPATALGASSNDVTVPLATAFMKGPVYGAQNLTNCFYNPWVSHARNPPTPAPSPARSTFDSAPGRFARQPSSFSRHFGDVNKRLISRLAAQGQSLGYTVELTNVRAPLF